MGTFLGVISIVAICGTVLAITFAVVVSLPQSLPLRAALIQIVGWVFAGFCLLYCLSPLDVLPEVFLGPVGFVDDLGALVAGIASARAAWKAGKDKAALSAANKQRLEIK